MVAHGNSQRGERMHMSKLTDDAVREIRASTLPRTELAERFGVTPSNISYIKRGKTWRHVQ
jgi:DNA-binding Xre family transcriptional regulator